MIATLLGVALPALAFRASARRWAEGETMAFDRMAVLAFRRPGAPGELLGPPWLQEMGRDVTALGSFAVLGLVLLAATGYLLIARKPRRALLMLGSVLGGVAASTLLKLAYDRPRPDLEGSARVFTASFPSGHAMLSAVVFLTLGALLARAETKRRLKAYHVGLAVLLTLLVGLSRLYLGVHYPTDIVAGWCVGAAWALACWSVAEALERRLEPSPSPVAE